MVGYSLNPHYELRGIFPLSYIFLKIAYDYLSTTWKSIICHAQITFRLTKSNISIDENQLRPIRFNTNVHLGMQILYPHYY